MAFISLQFMDLIFIAIDSIVLLGIAFYFYQKSNNPSNCRSLLVDRKMLKNWRFNLYSSIYITWIISYTTFIKLSIIRILLHPIFLALVLYNLKISLPAWFCKIRGISSSCNCDRYVYSDFIPMLILGIVINLILIFSSVSILMENILLLIGTLISIIIIFIPQKPSPTLMLEKELLINNIDEFQKFTMQSVDSSHILLLLDSKCEFCEIQLNELNKIQEEYKYRIKIIDITNRENMDPIIQMTLNIDNLQNFSVPYSYAFRGGMVVNQQEGVINYDQLNSLLMDI